MINEEQAAYDSLQASLDVSQPITVLHYLYFANKSDAEAVGAALKGDGDEYEVNESPDPGEWGLYFRRTEIVTPESLAQAREAFEGAAGKFNGEYDGWEVQIQRDQNE